MRKYLLSEEDIQFIRDNIAEMGYAMIAEKLDTTENTVFKIVKQYKIENPRKRKRAKYTAEEKKKYIIENKDKGMTEVVNRLGCSPSTYYNYIYAVKREELAPKRDKLRELIGKEVAKIKLKFCNELDELIELATYGLIILDPCNVEGAWEIKFI